MIKRCIRKAVNMLALRKNVEHGSNLHIGLGSIVWAPKKLLIGNDVYIGKGVTLQVDGVIGDNVLIANGVGIIGRSDHDMRMIGVPIRDADWVGHHPDRLSRPVQVGSDAWIGYGAIILSGVTIGDSSIIAAGAVVTSDVPPNSIAVGCPAHVVGQRFTDEEYESHWTILQRNGLNRLSVARR